MLDAQLGEETDAVRERGDEVQHERSLPESALRFNSLADRRGEVHVAESEDPQLGEILGTASAQL